MATASTHGKNVRPSPAFATFMWQEALFEWGIPALLGAGIAVVALLSLLDEIALTTGVTALGILLLLLVIFFPLKLALSAAVEPRSKAFILGFSLVWIGITCAQLYFAIFVGSLAGGGSLAANGAALTLPLGGQGTIYDVVVEGNFAASAGDVGREAGYVLSLEKDGQKIQEFTGVFSERSVRQRLGRRGSTTTHQLHNHVLHRFVSPGEGTYQLTAVRTDPQLAPTLAVSLYRDTYPEKTFWLLSALLLIGAYTSEVLLAGQEVPLVLVTAITLIFVITFRNLGVPPHSYRDLVGAAMVAAIAGPLGGWIFRIVADVIAKSLGFSRLKPATAPAGKGKGPKR
jgi:hypothetical protein